MQLYLSGASLLIVFEIPQWTLHKKLSYQKGANNTRALCYSYVRPLGYGARFAQELGGQRGGLLFLNQLRIVNY